jgi:hypothetical protein
MRPLGTLHDRLVLRRREVAVALQRLILQGIKPLNADLHRHGESFSNSARVFFHIFVFLDKFPENVSNRHHIDMRVKD